jgi:hypothetical protein
MVIGHSALFVRNAVVTMTLQFATLLTAPYC